MPALAQSVDDCKFTLFANVSLFADLTSNGFLQAVCKSLNNGIEFCETKELPTKLDDF
jgi:hypothetical protein